MKVLAPPLALSGPARKRFAREAQATAAIQHPSVMPILTVHSAGKLPYLVMPYVACESLQQRIAREGPLATVDILRIGMQTARALAAAHAQGLVHRDVKPANILLERGVDRAILTDFGLARAVDDASITRTGVIAGTPQFMSPEQAKGEAVDARSDLFSLGGVLYTMAAGRPPFRAESTYGILRRIADDVPRPLREINPEIPDWLAATVDKLLAKSPTERFASADEVAAALERCLAHVQQPAAFELPPAVASLVSEFLPVQGAARSEPGWRRAWSGGKAPGLRALAALAMCLTIALAAIAISNRDPATLSQPPTDSPQAVIDPPPSPHGPVSSDDPILDWDHAARRLDGLSHDIDQFEPLAKSLWDQAPDNSK